MDGRTIRDVAAAVAAGAAVLLLADLSLGWHSVDVTAGGVVSISADATGWNGVGLVAGLAAIAMLVAMLRPVRGEGAVGPAQALVVAMLAFAALGFTVAAALTGAASVTAPETAIEVSSRLWPAWAGIGLAAVVAGGALTALAEVLRGVTAPSHALRPTT